MKCWKCDVENDNSYNYCRNCGAPLSDKLILQSIAKFLKPIIWLTLIFIMIGVIWYISLPNLSIYPETSKVRFNSNGGNVEIPIHTNAKFSQWHVTGPDFIDLTKKANSILIRCHKNYSRIIGERKGQIALFCEGKNKEKVYIDIAQEEYKENIYADVKEIIQKHNVYRTSYGEEKKGVELTAKCKIRNYKGKLRCIISFYHSNGEKYINKESHYTNFEKQLTVQKDFFPNMLNGQDVVMFIPYSEFYNEQGIYMKVRLLEYKSSVTGSMFYEKTFKEKTFKVTK